MPPSTLSGSPKSITHGSIPASCRMPTAPSSRVTSHMLADIIIGCTISTGGPAAACPAGCPAGNSAAACTSARSRRSGTARARRRSPARRAQHLEAVLRRGQQALDRPGDRPVIAERFRSTRCSPTKSAAHVRPRQPAHHGIRTALRPGRLAPARARQLGSARWHTCSGLRALHLEYPDAGGLRLVDRRGQRGRPHRHRRPQRRRQIQPAGHADRATHARFAAG